MSDASAVSSSPEGAGLFTFLHPIRETFFKQRDPEKAFSQIESYLQQDLTKEEKRATFELAALVLQALGNYDKARSLYQEIGDTYQAGYCSLLNGNLAQVGRDWSTLELIRPNHWGLTLLGMVTKHVTTFPTLLQVRSHLECDLYNLITAHQLQCVDHILLHSDWLSQINLETHKYVGRALMNHGYLEEAEESFLKGQKAIPNDPEIYFHLGQVCVELHKKALAQQMLNQCLLICPSYVPATELLERM